MKKTVIRNFCIGAFSLMFALLTTALGQGITTSAISGFVTDKQGKPVAGATITALHEPSGTRATATTRSNGQYSISGLRPGGPYTVSVSGASIPADSQKDIYLSLNDNASVSFGTSGEVVKLEAFTVSDSKDTTFGAGRMGSGKSFSDFDIQGIASVRDHVQDIARVDSRLTLNSLDVGGQLSAQGQNFRFNSFLIDGVESNDPFGLKSDGAATLRSPVANESLSAVDIQLNPYDARKAGFTGALINMVTRSGTNEFHGSATYQFSDQDYRAKNPNPASTFYGQREPFKERTYNIGIGGPILRDRLFFYYNYDDFRRTASAPATNFRYTDQAQIDAIVARAKALGYDVGSLGGASSNLTTQKTHLGKIDWNISDSHRLSLTYRKNEGTQPNFAGSTSVFGQSFSNYWYDTPSIQEVYSAQINNQWTPDFRTEASFTQTKWTGTPANRGAPFPAVQINGLTGIRGDTGATITTGSVLLGTEFSRQLNVLNTKETNAKVSGDYSLGDHTITVGGENMVIKYYNAFLQGYYGSYTFASVATWQSGTPSAYTDAAPFPGYTINDAIAKWKYQAYAGFIQDTWKPNSRLTVVGGVRLDYPYVPEKPVYNAAFAAAFGLRNDTNNSGNYTIAPRFGFNYRVPTDRKTELRGGLGLFQGRNPAVWLSNAYSAAGAAGTVTVNNPAITFQPDVTKQPIPPGTPPTPNINITDPKFKQPVVWKANVAIDHQLPFGGLVLTGELNAIKTHKALAIQFLNFLPATDGGAATMPDGRIRYAGNISPNYSTAATPNNTTTFPQTSLTGRRRLTSFAEVYKLTNTSKGESHSMSLSLNRPLKNGWGGGVSWTHGHATEVAPMTSSTAGSLFGLRAVYNPNEDIATTSNTNTEDKIVASVTKQFQFYKKYRTTVSMIYVGQTGHAYSWVFKGDANGDGFTDNDVFYMPSGTNDPKVRWNSTAERDAFAVFASANGLDKYAGTVIPRNAAVSPWNNTVDLSITQDIPVYGRVKTQLFVQVINFANFFKKDWGLLEEVPFSYKRTIAGAIYDRAANGGQGQYVYLFNSNTFATVPVVAGDQAVSRWQVKAGVKLTF